MRPIAHASTERLLATPPASYGTRGPASAAPQRSVDALSDRAARHRRSATPPVAAPLAPVPAESSARAVALRRLRGVATAPFKLVATPVAGALVGAAAGALGGLAVGGSVLPMLAIAVGERSGANGGEDRRSATQRGFENGVMFLVGAPLVVGVFAGSVALAAGGGALGAAGGAIVGFGLGAVEGYQAAWDNRAPKVPYSDTF